MDCRRQPLQDLRVLLNSRAKNISTKICKNNDLNKEIVVIIHNDKTTKIRPADVFSDLDPKEKVNAISSTPILRYNQIFNTKATEYIENSQKVTNAYHQSLAASFSLEYANQNLQKLQLDACKSVAFNENHPGIEKSQILYNNNYDNSLKTIHIENNIINSIKALNCVPQNTKNKMDRQPDGTNTQNELNINNSIILLPNTAPTSKMQKRMDEALEAVLYIISNNFVTEKSITKSDLKLFSPTLRNVISDRIINVLTGHPVRSRSDIIDRYLKRYPTETDVEVFKLYKMDTHTRNKQNASNINSDIILLPNTAPTSKMQKRMDEALEAILYIISNNFVTQKIITKSDLKLFSPRLRNVISDRIVNVLTGHPVRSRSDIIDRYLKRYPTETDVEVFKLYKMDTHTRNKRNASDINSDIILLPNTAPTSKMQEIMDEALEAILYRISNNFVTQKSITKSDLKLFSPMLRNVISDRLIIVLTGHPICSRSNIIYRYLKRYPTETHVELFKLYKTRHGTHCVLYLTQTDNPKHFFGVNMMRLINTKVKKIITVVENMFKNSKRQLLRLKKQTKSNDSNGTIQKTVYYDQYTNCLVEREFSRLLMKFKNEIVHMILHKETTQAIRLNVLKK